jgi:hypothetical protein
MSATLIKDKSAPQTFIDDVELAIYVVLWTLLIYSPNSLSVPLLTFFVSSVLDPKQYDGTGRTNKTNFLKGRTISQGLTFHSPSQPLLLSLIEELAVLFSVRYKNAPTPEQVQLFRQLQNNPHVGPDILENLPVGHYENCLQSLHSHTHVIELFNVSIELSDQWPVSDCATKQPLTPLLNAQQGKRTKTNWDAADSDRPLKRSQLNQTEDENEHKTSSSLDDQF